MVTGKIQDIIFKFFSSVHIMGQFRLGDSGSEALAEFQLKFSAFLHNIFTF